MSRKQNIVKKRKLKGILITCGAIVFIVLAIVALEFGNIIDLYHPHAATNMKPPVQTTSTLPSAQSNFTNGDNDNNKDAGNTLNENRSSATVSDTGGIPSSDTSKPISSATGEITVYLPIKDATISSGQEISGTSSLPSVSYRLIDNVSGVIATGTLSVVNGNFSGKISFVTNATNGRLDIFGVKPDFTEFSNIEVPIRY